MFQNYQERLCPLQAKGQRYQGRQQASGGVINSGDDQSTRRRIIGTGKGTFGSIGAEKSKKRMVTIDVLKGICILMVIMTHVEGRTEEFKRFIFYPFTVLPAVSMFMILTACVFTMSEDSWAAKTGEEWTILAWFRKERFLSRLWRFLIPFAIGMIVLTAGIVVLLKPAFFTRNDFYIMVRSGGRGPGAYYNRLVFEFLASFPFFKHWFEKDSFQAVAGMSLLHILFTSAARYVWNLSDMVYDRMIFRFLAHIALGIILAKYHRQIRNTMIPVVCIVTGVIFILNVSYFGYSQVMQPARFSSSSLIHSLFSFGVICIVMGWEDFANRYRKLLYPICYIGESSYHILLTQMIWFYFARSFHFEKEILKTMPCILLTDYSVCIVIGCLLYFLETRIRSFLHKRRRRS